MDGIGFLTCSDSHPLHRLSNPGHQTTVCIDALRGERIEFCSVFILLLLDESVRDKPPEIFDESWIVQPYPVLQISLLHGQMIVVHLIQKSR